MLIKRAILFAWACAVLFCCAGYGPFYKIERLGSAEVVTLVRPYTLGGSGVFLDQDSNLVPGYWADSAGGIAGPPHSVSLDSSLSGGSVSMIWNLEGGTGAWADGEGGTVELVSVEEMHRRNLQRVLIQAVGLLFGAVCFVVSRDSWWRRSVDA